MSNPAEEHPADGVGADLDAWAAAHAGPDAEVVACARMPGHSSRTYGVDIARGGEVDRLVLRLPPSGTARQAAALLRQVRLLRVVGAHGVPVPEVRWSDADTRWFGVPYTMVTRMPGAAPGDVLTDPVPVAADRDALFPQAVDALAAVHAVDVGRHLAGWGERLEPGAVVDRWSRMLEHYGEPGQAAAAVAGLRRHLPVDAGEVGLVHGDFYSNNWLFDGPRLSAVLDWEAAHIGPPEADLGWLAMMYDPASWDPAHRPDIALSPAPEVLLARYEARSGRALTDPYWFRALAGVRMAALTTYFLAQHRHGDLHDPTWERIATSVPFLLARAVDLLR